jgi:hypothetical protein
VGVVLSPASPDSGNACGRFADQCGPLLASVRLLLRFLAEEIRWNKRFGRPSQRTIKSMCGASPESVEAEWLLEPRRLSEPDVIFVHDVELGSFRRRGGDASRGSYGTP